MKPKWQRARILHTDSSPEVIGCEIWVKMGPPVMQDANGAHGGWSPPELRYDAAILPNDSFSIGVCVCAEDIELLARDENDFAEDVPLIPWEQFLAECRAKAHGLAGD